MCIIIIVKIWPPRNLIDTWIFWILNPQLASSVHMHPLLLLLLTLDHHFNRFEYSIMAFFLLLLSNASSGCWINSMCLPVFIVVFHSFRRFKIEMNFSHQCTMNNEIFSLFQFYRYGFFAFFHFTFRSRFGVGMHMKSTQSTI